MHTFAFFDPPNKMDNLIRVSLPFVASRKRSSIFAASNVGAEAAAAAGAAATACSWKHVS